MSVESQIVEILNQLGCAVSNFSLIAGICSVARTNSALNSARPFDLEDAKAHLSVARRMLELSKLCKPVPVDWTNVSAVREVLAGLASGILQIAIIHQEAAPAPVTEGFNVFLERGYFKSRQRTILDRYEIMSTNYPALAPVMPESVALQVISKLDELGLRGRAIRCKQINEDNFCQDFEAVWRIR